MAPMRLNKVQHWSPFCRPTDKGNLLGVDNFDFTAFEA